MIALFLLLGLPHLFVGAQDEPIIEASPNGELYVKSKEDITIEAGKLQSNGSYSGSLRIQGSPPIKHWTDFKGEKGDPGVASSRLTKLEQAFANISSQLSAINAAVQIVPELLITIDFNQGVDAFGRSKGNLLFTGAKGFQVIFTDDDSNGKYGGAANGVHITSEGYGNIKKGTQDFVLGAYNDWVNPTNNFHSSGIVAQFSHGVQNVTFDCTDDDSTLKRLYAFDDNGNVIGQTPASSQTKFSIDLKQTNGKIIYSMEFDTLPGPKGGSTDGTYFTLDNFQVSGIVSDRTRVNDLALESLTRILNPKPSLLIDLGTKLVAGKDDLDQTNGDLLFSGNDGFQMLATDDGYFNSLTTDVVMNRQKSTNRLQPSNKRGLLVIFNYGLTQLTLTSNTSIAGQKVFAYDTAFNSIAVKTSASLLFSVNATDTGGRLIYAVELDIFDGGKTGAQMNNPFSIAGLKGWGSLGVRNTKKEILIWPLRKLLNSRVNQGGPVQIQIQQLLKLDFDCGADSVGQSSGDLLFTGVNGFQLMLTDDDSDGKYGGQANGVHITNKKYGNDKAGTADMVVGANNNWVAGGQTNYHSSGIVAKFSHGVENVSLLCTDDDSTTKSLYAFDESGAEIGKTAPGSRRTFYIDTTMTNGKLIYAVEFDTLSAEKGGSTDGTYFTVDDIEITGKVTGTTARKLLAKGFTNSVASPSRSLISLSFNNKKDSFSREQGDLVFVGDAGFRVLFTDDDSSGNSGGNADGVHVTNKNYGNSKVGSSSDYVLGAYNSRPSASVNYHSSGIVARFSHGATEVGLQCTDDDGTTKSLFAFDEAGSQIGKTAPGSRIPFKVDTTMTSKKLIYSVEFDTQAGTAGGAADGTVFTIDDFYVRGPVPCSATQISRNVVSLKSDFFLVNHKQLIFLDFNSGVDHMGRSQGDLVFIGDDGFQVLFVDDDSSGSTYGGDADGVHISNQNYGNDKVGTDDLVLGAYNSKNGNNNYHSSGIVARFSHGMQRVSLECTDDDSTTKSLFAFDEDGKQVGKTAAGSRRPFVIDTTMTSGKLIFSVEFDTQAGTAGGSFDGTYFTIDNFKVEGVVSSETLRGHF